MAIKKSTPNQIGSIPALITKGMKNGSVNSIMLTWSTKQPSTNKIRIMATISMLGLKSSEPTALRKPLVAPENPKSWEKAVAPTMMKSTMHETCTVPLRDCTKPCQVKAR